MKFQFDPNLDFQLEAVEATCDLFRGQELCRTEFSVTAKTQLATPKADLFLTSEQVALGLSATGLGIGNRLSLLDDQLLTNLQAVQLNQGLPISQDLDSRDFTIEMETGTGKTYVYLRTIFELNKRYGFTKFVIVVPSVAIKEGVYKSLEMMANHFRTLYAGTPFDYFLYDSSKLGQVRNFATSSTIQVMIVTVGAINKQDVNNLYKENEKTGGDRPIDLIRETRPILIVDEPQSVDGGLAGRGKEALGLMNPLCTLRYSATHVDKHHMIYRLDAVDAYTRKLVKQIEVASATIEQAHNRPYVKLISTSNRRGSISAKVELDVEIKGTTRRMELMVLDGQDLEQETKRALYADHFVGEIRTGKGQACMELRVPGNVIWLQPGESYGDVNTQSIQREMIRRTIKEHLDKEKRFGEHGIKILSLFFIDEVSRYRSYSDDGEAIKGELATIFEEEYQRLAKHPDYTTLFGEVDLRYEASRVHDGYFSIDRNGSWTDTAENNQTNRSNAERAYNLIMKDKEKLLSFETPLKFIFSHSALKEGWDNPNVFQICTLRDIRTERERRQTLGRGLRLCVNQQGERQQGFDINTLTVVALEDYQDFAEKLQREIEEDTGIRFGVVEAHHFQAIPLELEDGSKEALGHNRSEQLVEHLKSIGYINAQGKVQDLLREALADESVELPQELEPIRNAICRVLQKLAGRLEIKNADERKTAQAKRAVLDDPGFRELWDRVKYKSSYRVQFDNEKLIQGCITEIQKCPPIPRSRLHWRKADIEIGEAGVQATERSGEAFVALNEQDLEWPDLLTELQDRTQLTRRSLLRILKESDRLREFPTNPQQFIEQTADAIKRSKRMAIVDGIKYQRLGDEHYYAQELFEQEELTGYLKSILKSERSVYDYVVYDSEVERHFAEQMDRNEAVKVFAKLPGWFQVPTPLGSYNPDWAVLIHDNEGERLYFVVETKGGLFDDDLREKERAKIECGKKHFQAIGVAEQTVDYVVARTWEDVQTHIEKKQA